MVPATIGRRSRRSAAPSPAAATVGIGRCSEGGFGLDIDLKVSLPGLDRADAERLVQAAH
jgi:organic hydroperoxide reductase OsmC/OhrA